MVDPTGSTLKCIACIVIVLASRSNAGSTSDQPEVTIEQGTLRGVRLTSEFRQRPIAGFFGVPYAVPPVGQRRFKLAEPAKPWPGILNATHFGPSCAQYSHFTQGTDFEIYGSEDCLYLNVYTPKLPDGKTKGKLLNVVFYIHGGAFMFLSGDRFGSEFLLDKDLVMVTLNYRLGPFGFLSTEDEVVPGNNGLKDQLLALKWVRKNIAKFGGNPDRIAIAGNSAGGASAHYHVLSPKSRGLFNRAIIMSGAVLNPWPQTENALEKAKKISMLLGCPTEESSAMVECLRSRPAEHILEKTKLFIPWVYSPFTPFGPVVEVEHADAFITQQPLDIIMNGEASDVPILFSHTADEGLYPGSQIIENETLMADLRDDWDEILPHLLDYNYTIPENRRTEVAKAIRQFYIQSNEQAAAGVIHMLSDRLFVDGIRESAKLHAKLYKSPVYAYVFSFKGSRRGFMKTEIYDGVSHADDLAYLVKKVIPWGMIGTDSASQDMVRGMVNLWADFISE
ncbi:unnamed protein product [Nesidiocoris tenuis]|uniref:Carboxylic ester hydrolase n=1 Tax=Nesidiocoris tenuis TaxID=355587 RepID=A0A6H5GGD8_9HEMI|nr:unnamed protein product [Nesidiocoris tenuis]